MIGILTEEGIVIQHIVHIDGLAAVLFVVYFAFKYIGCY